MMKENLDMTNRDDNKMSVHPAAPQQENAISPTTVKWVIWPGHVCINGKNE